MITLRQVSASSQWQAIAAIFNHYVRTSSAAYPNIEISGQHFLEGWLQLPTYPFYEALDGDSVVGFCFLKPFHPADTMQHVAVLTYFIDPTYTGKGLGKSMLEQLLSDGQQMGKTNFMANISSENEGSIRFHQKHGFRECGRFQSIGKKADRSFDMVWMQRMLAP